MNMNQIFSIPLWESPFPDFEIHKTKFLETVNDFRLRNPENNIRSNFVGGYQSPINLTNEEDLSNLFQFISQMGLKASFDLQFVDVEIYLSAAWVNFQDTRLAFHVDHVHQDTFSGVFFLQVPEHSGKLVINNSGINPLWQGAMLQERKNKFNCDKIKIDPEEGQIYLWPSYLPHSVEPNNHDESRISISFNVICVPKVPIPHTK